MVLVTTLLFAAIASAKCYEPTTAYPPPDFDPEDIVLKQAFASIQATLKSTVSSSDFDWSSFSIEVTSSKESLWSYHHTARERNASRPDIPKVNGDALYRIASITKTFTVLGLLHQHQAGKLHLDDPIEKYIKELKEEQDGTLPWKDITLRSLASQLSGIPREFAQADLINNPSFLRPPQDVGLPPVSRDGLPECDEYSPNYETPCTAHDLIKRVKSQRPVFAPNMKSTYSNVAFELLGVALSRVTGQSYESYIHDAIFKPLGMSKSTFKKPADSAGVIPKYPHFWDVDHGIQNPTGGIYSSLNDMTKYVRYVLTHYNALATGVNWFNVGSANGGVNGFYGMPWEIFHTDRVFKDSRRAVRFITKGGGLPGYLSIIALAPEYDLGITILVADNTDLLQKILELVSTTIIRAADTIATRQLKERYVDTYSEHNTHDTQNTVVTESSRTKFVIEADSRGLIVKEFSSNNTDVLRNGFKRGPLSDNWYAQLVPTLLYVDEKNKAGQLWRILAVDERSGDGNVWDDFCVSDFDGPFYASTPFNQVAFWDFKDGRYQTVELSAFRRNLTRVSDDTFLDEPEAPIEL